ncbi:MAG: UvrD-helicase domain-containing protein [Roseitalea sp.]|nr:UvrD-helicase domain-containing protein [Roseitalea sp.]MBO6951433.1 UvrD-helicase domain-containing protein [Rhizobiaceae bacterium]MBO6592720.1 UvrD-helicase domain-containing protein [Roseitalea sp.]MBO6598975.1 UvrD-helicase domain-containing protein [Roseitalea sp.]MBO6611422.1 UvrD-helicase domain-containing protein [Roseitalea sp.]
MEFRIADTFTDSLLRLTVQEQKAVKTTAFDMQLDPSAPGFSFHRLDRAKDPNFWSVRVNADIRIIVHRTASSLLLAYVDHHDKAYAWAERRKIERHPTTGAMQLVEVRERIEEIEAVRPAMVDTPVPPASPKIFDGLAKPELMAFGVPEEWIEDVAQATEDSLFDIIEHLPQEAQEALLNLAVGETPEPPKPLPVEADPFSHPDAARRFRVFTNVEELSQALDYPWEKWAIFLHPDQRRLVERDWSGPARVSGSAGTGKTIVALHRAVHLARWNPDARVLLTTFSKALANALKRKLHQLAGNEPAVAGRITVQALSGVGYDLYAALHGQPNIASAPVIQTLLAQAAKQVEGHAFSSRFLHGEWTEVVDAWQLMAWDAYRDVSRLGRKTRIGGRQREILWSIFECVRQGLAERKLVTWPDLFGRLERHIRETGKRPFDIAVVDEAQDLSVAEARFLAALGADQPEGLFFTGDLGQRIFQQPFSWKALGIDVRGRSHTLRVNYRTSHQIRAQADRLLPSAIADVDGNEESRKGTISVFDGPLPEIRILRDEAEEGAVIGRWIAERLQDGCQPHEIGVFVRSGEQLRRARTALKKASALFVELSEKIEAEAGKVAVSTMHLAKGLEFRAVAVMACDDEVIPLQERIESVADDADLEEVYTTERHLLYVACTRARDHLLVTGVAPGSEFLDDMSSKFPE